MRRDIGEAIFADRAVRGVRGERTPPAGGVPKDLAETGVRIPDTESVNDTRDSRVVTCIVS